MKKRPAPVAARASTASTTRIKRKKRRFMLSVPKRGFYSQKRPAFDAFEVCTSLLFHSTSFWLKMDGTKLTELE
jgi:hypothetical protein